jgi:2'-5' RNA ligase
MSDRLRLFFAVEVPSEIRTELETFSQSIDRKNWRLVKPDQMHITLAFMGEVAEEKLEEVLKIGEKAAANFSSFGLQLADSGVFPETGEPRVLFARVVSDELIKLALALREDLGPLADQKKVRPHLTLARRKGERARKDLRKIRGGWQVASFTLFKSSLTDNGATHEVLKRFELSQSSDGPVP